MIRFVVIIFILFGLTTQSQDIAITTGNRRSLGFQAELGIPIQYLRPNWRRYWPVMLGCNYYFPIYKTKNFFNLGLDIYPHVAIAFTGQDKEKEEVDLEQGREYEAGINLRLNINFAVTKRDQLSLVIGAGPHWFTLESNRQVNGFIFSDYILGSYKRDLSNDNSSAYVQLYAGLRHLSNANIELPNDGINNIIVGIAIGRLYKLKQR